MIKIFIYVVIIFVGIQFITIDTKEHIESDLKNEIVVSSEIKTILKRSCYDCHSNDSTIPWYGNIAPSSWFVRLHINDGREILNFSEFKKYDADKQKDLFDRIEDSIVIRMPLASYVWLHKDASLSQEDKAKLKAWSKEEFSKI
ncbi:MAG: heme-binding domain-containing protein [Campylobacterales bacterium]|nr:heme-binding domain-containing protein [Campylobacterales bacterium]